MNNTIVLRVDILHIEQVEFYKDVKKDIKENTHNMIKLLMQNKIGE